MLNKKRPIGVTLVAILNATISVLFLIMALFDSMSPNPWWRFSYPEWTGVFRGALAFTGVLFLAFAYGFWRGNVLSGKSWAGLSALFYGWLFNFGIFLGTTIAYSLGLGGLSDPGFNSAFMVTFGILGLVVVHIAITAHCLANPHAKAFLEKV